MRNDSCKVKNEYCDLIIEISYSLFDRVLIFGSFHFLRYFLAHLN